VLPFLVAEKHKILSCIQIDLSKGHNKERTLLHSYRTGLRRNGKFLDFSLLRQFMSKVLVLKAAPALALAAPAATGGAMTTTGAATGGAITTGRAAQLGAGATLGSKGTSGLIALSRTMAETPFGDEQQMAQKEAENRAAYQRLAGETRQLMREGANINTTQFS
jgi:hypothetical protein